MGILVEKPVTADLHHACLWQHGRGERRALTTYSVRFGIWKVWGRFCVFGVIWSWDEDSWKTDEVEQEERVCLIFDSINDVKFAQPQ